ncbi:dihydrofolate reductase family protein [Nocardia amikacinitolerans]|uniref:dihydrofolate reductase family protein n=1 Tax=Nocardia amikacinitolerans TaxID=756689 RepID=UPI0036CD7BCD
MRKLVYYVGVSLDGYIAGPGGEFDFYPLADDMSAWVNGHYPEPMPTRIRPLVGMPVDTPNKNWDTVLMGRATYEAGEVTSPFTHLKQYVISNTFDPSSDPAVEVVAGDAVDFVRKLKQADGLDIWLCGGGNLAAQLACEIDELIIKSYPVVAGSGIPAFAGAFTPTLFTPTRRMEFSNNAQVTWYSRS